MIRYWVTIPPEYMSNSWTLLLITCSSYCKVRFLETGQRVWNFSDFVRVLEKPALSWATASWISPCSASPPIRGSGAGRSFATSILQQCNMFAQKCHGHPCHHTSSLKRGTFPFSKGGETFVALDLKWGTKVIRRFKFHDVQRDGPTELKDYLRILSRLGQTRYWWPKSISRGAPTWCDIRHIRWQMIWSRSSRGSIGSRSSHICSHMVI